jgi:RNA polymerase sigma-70 factor (ECF subfamily)
MDVAENDLDLIHRAKAGDNTAFDELVRRYNRRTYQVVYGLIHSHADAEDLTQETFIRAFEHIGGFKEEFRFYTWLYRIAVNLCFTFLKRRKRAPVELPGSDEQGDPEIPDERSVAMDEQADQKRNIERALSRLPPDQRTALVLRTYQDLSYAEIADVMDTSIGTVMSRLSRAREKMRGLLSDYMAGVQ